VGSVAARLVDGTRPAYAGARSAGRALFVKVWYPAVRADMRPELLWDELRRDPGTPRPIRLVLALSRTRTSTHPAAELDARAVLRSLVVYNHGMISFASENTSLMEHLASRGHVVVSIRHVEQLAELNELNRDRTADQRRRDAEWQRRLRARREARVGDGVLRAIETHEPHRRGESARHLLRARSRRRDLASSAGARRRKARASADPSRRLLARRCGGPRDGGARRTHRERREPRRRAVRHAARAAGRPALSDALQRRERRHERRAAAAARGALRVSGQRSSRLPRREPLAAVAALREIGPRRARAARASEPNRRVLPRASRRRGSRVVCRCGGARRATRSVTARSGRLVLPSTRRSALREAKEILLNYAP